MKTIKIARTIRRQLPNGLLAWIGPEGVRIRQKRSVPLYSLSWKEIWERAQFLGATHTVAAMDALAKESATQAEMFIPPPASVSPAGHLMVPVTECPLCRGVYATPQKTFTCGGCGKAGFTCCIPYGVCQECRKEKKE
jgi:hypothetical protein